jgi:hypothetical protein
VFYVDSSAYLAILLGEDGSETLVDELDGAALVSSVLLLVETERTLVRLSRAGDLTADQLQTAREQLVGDAASFALRDLTIDLCRDLAFPLVTVPRSLDLVHLQTAKWFHAREQISRFVTLDDAQGRAARELGLPV